MTEKTPNQKLVLLQRGWLDLWPSALAQWSRFTLLREPVWCYTDEQAAAEGVDGELRDDPADGSVHCD